MTGVGNGIYFIGIVPAVLLAIWLTVIMLMAREPRPEHSRRDPRQGSTPAGEEEAHAMHAGQPSRGSGNPMDL